MKKKIINGLLFAVAMVAATSSFVSCKDYNGDNDAELQEKYLTLQAAFDNQVTAMKAYVLQTQYDTEVGTDYPTAKGTIKKRLEDLETDLANQKDDKVENSLAWQIAQNNIAIATARGLAERDSIYLYNLLYGWSENGTRVLGDMITDAAELLTHMKNNKDAYDKAVENAQAAYNFIKDSKFNNIKELETAYDGAVADMKADIEALQKDINNLMKFAKEQVYGINLDAVENPIFGSINYPFGFKTTILAAYYGEFDKKVYFPAGDLDDGVWANETAAILNSELQEIGAPEDENEKGIQMVEGPGNAGTIYMTINPSRANIENKEFTLRTSNNNISKVVLGKPEASDFEILAGWSRRAGNDNGGFYAATAEIKKENVNDVALSFNLKGLATEIQNIMSDWSKTSASDIAKLALAVHDGMNVKTPLLSVTTQWKDTLGWTKVSSERDITAFSVKPLGYDFLYKMDFSGGIVKFKNKLTAKEKAFSQEIQNMFASALDLPVGSTDIVKENGKYYLVIKLNAGDFGQVDFRNLETAIYNATGGTYTPSIGIVKLPTATSPAATTGIKVEITTMFNTIQHGLDGASGKVADVINKFINFQNKIFGKVESVANNPNRYIQPALIGKCNQLGYFYPSRLYLAPTQVQRGQKIEFRPTTLTAEVVAPAYKKYVAVSGAWSVDDINDSKPAVVKQLNAGNEVLNTVFYGAKYNAENGFVFDTANIPAGTVVELIYECLGYNGKVAGKKYYIEVYE